MANPRLITVRLQYFLAISIVALLSSCSQRNDAAKDPPPHVVLIILDTLRADVLGCYGSTLGATPELDAIADDGVRFASVIASSSWTQPSIGAMLTGLGPRRLGLYNDENEMLADKFFTLAEVLKQAGYATFGMTANPNINSFFNFHQGFDEYIDSHVVFDKMDHESGDVSWRKAKLTSAREVYAATLRFARANTRSPCYLQLDVMELHEYFRGEKKLTRPEFAGLFTDTKTPDYLQAARQVSLDTAAFIEELSVLPGWENTLFVLVSDHGEGLDSHPAVPRSDRHGNLLYESQVMVPWILYHPGFARFQRTVVKDPVRILDFFPTVLDYLRVPIPNGLDGVSLLSLLDGQPVPMPPYFIAETEFHKSNKIAVYDDEWIYIENRDAHKTLNPRELQQRGGGENGALTDLLASNAAAAAPLREYLAQWENDHPKSPPTRQNATLSNDERQQLESIGYLKQ